MNKQRKLLELKEWLTVTEASQYLSVVFDQIVTEPDVLRFGLAGRLRLSVRFVNHAQARRYHERSEAELQEGHERIQQRIAECAAAKAAGLPIPPPRERVWSPEQLEDQRILTLTDGVYDLPMIGAERLDVMHEFEQLTGGPEVTLIAIGGTFVDREDGTRLEIQTRFENDLVDKDRPYFSHRNYFPAGGLPEDSVLVVRASALREFEERALIDSAVPTADASERSLAQRERTSLLTIIAALAEQADIDVSRPSKAAVAIEALTTSKGTRIAARTVENHLKLIPDALDRSRKLS